MRYGTQLWLPSGPLPEHREGKCREDKIFAK